MTAKEKGQAELGAIDIRPGDVFRHYKGGLYAIVALSVQEDDGRVLVTYRSNRHRTNWTRTVANFAEVVDLAGAGPVPRFHREQD